MIQQDELRSARRRRADEHVRGMRIAVNVTIVERQERERRRHERGDRRRVEAQLVADLLFPRAVDTRLPAHREDARRGHLIEHVRYDDVRPPLKGLGAPPAVARLRDEIELEG